MDEKLKLQEALRQMEHTNPSIGMVSDNYHRVGTDFITNQPVYKQINRSFMKKLGDQYIIQEGKYTVTVPNSLPELDHTQGDWIDELLT